MLCRATWRQERAVQLPVRTGSGWERARAGKKGVEHPHDITVRTEERTMTTPTDDNPELLTSSPA